MKSSEAKKGAASPIFTIIVVLLILGILALVYFAYQPAKPFGPSELEKGGQTKGQAVGVSGTPAFLINGNAVAGQGLTRIPRRQ